MAEQEEGFVFVDKRRAANPEATQDTDASPTPEPDKHSASAEADDAPETGDEQHPRLAARDRILMCADILHQGAWIALGLVPDPVTNKLEQELNDARILIDCFADLAQRMEPLVDETIRRDLRDRVAMLRVNYVKQAGKTG